MTWEIRQGDCIDRLREMPDESVQTCVTSPPYWGLRDYGTDGQLGLEATPEEFVANMVDVFREVRRVLREDGTLWLNLGDSYNTQQAGNKKPSGFSQTRPSRRSGNGDQETVKHGRGLIEGLKPKDLVGIPWMVAFALRADGWYLRRDVIWAKPNPMPESVTDRPTSAHEYLFLLTKSPRYFYDAEAIREGEAVSVPARGFKAESQALRQSVGSAQSGGTAPRTERHVVGRNKRSVWTIATRPYTDAHFATFPPDLVEPCIRAGTPPKCCGECGAPWRRMVDVSYENPGNRTTNGPRSTERRHETAGFEQRLEKRVETTGWEPTCNHDDDSSRSVVLDPFSGAATTGLVATQLDRDYVGLELNPEYVQMSEDRIRRWEANPAGHLKADAPMAGQLSITDVLQKAA